MILIRLHTRRFCYLFLISLAGLFSCADDIDEPPLTLSEFYTCHHEKIWNEISTRDSLIGIWDWIYEGRFNSGRNVEYQEITFEFKPDSTLVTKVRDSITQISSWVVMNGDADMYAVDANPFVGHLIGSIQFCNDLVLFNNSERDLVDNYFRKRN